MLKNFMLQITIALFMMILVSNAIAENSDKIFAKTKINFSDIINSKDIKNVSVEVGPWVVGDLCLPPSAFPNEDIKKKIKGTSSIFADVEFLSKMKCAIRLAKFDSTDEANLAFWDTYGIGSGLEKYSLLSGKKIVGATVITYDIYEDSVLGFLIYKNCVCRLRFFNGNKTKINRSEHGFIDDFIIKMKTVIDQSSNF